MSRASNLVVSEVENGICDIPSMVSSTKTFDDDVHSTSLTTTAFSRCSQNFIARERRKVFYLCLKKDSNCGIAIFLFASGKTYVILSEIFAFRRVFCYVNSTDTLLVNRIIISVNKTLEFVMREDGVCAASNN